MNSNSDEGHLRRWMARLFTSSPAVIKTTSENATSYVAGYGPNRTLSGGFEADQVARPSPTDTKAGFRDATSDQPRTPTFIELDTIEWGQQLNGPGSSSPSTPQQLEANRGATSPVSSEARQVVATTLPTIQSPYMNRWRIPVLILAFFIQGLNDSAPGALLPYMERFYNVSHSVISLIFIANALGFIVAAPICHKLNNSFGRARVLSCCTALNALAFISISCSPPFAVVVVAFLLLGFGFATILALDNVFLINFQGGTVLLGYMHGMYGVGGICAPFIATAMVSSGIHWSLFYTIPLTLSLLNSASFYWTFRNYESETAPTQLQTDLDRTLSHQTTRSEKRNILKKAIKNHTTLLGALLIFAYQGAEVAISGWVISFLIDYRNGAPSQVGYVTSGFWGGITLGRFILVTPAHKLGDRISLVVLIAGTAAFQFMVWFLPNVIGNAVAVAIIGFLLGPIYPCATGVFSRLLPHHLQISSLGFIAGVGSSGGAIMPFLTGLLAQRLGTIVLNPICIALCVVMAGAWLALPKVEKRTE